MELKPNVKLSDLSPKEKSKYYFIRAKRLFIEGGQFAVVVEYVLKDVLRAMSLDPRNPKHYMFMGKVYRCSLDIVSAIYCYRFVLQLDPTSFVARDKLAECLQLLGQELMCEALKYKDTKGGYDTVLYRRAKYCVEEASKFKLEDQRLRIFGLVCLVHLNKLDQALEVVNRLTKHSKSPEPELFILRAKLLWASGLVGEGNKDIRYAAASYPDHPEVLAYSERVFSKAERLYSMSLEAFALERYSDARRLVVYALSISKEDVKLLILLAKILRMLGDMKGAYATIQKAMLIYQDTVSLGFDVPEEIVRQTNLIFNEMAIKYATEGEYERSVALLSKIISSEKALSRGLTDIDPKYYLNRGDCYRMMHDMPHALADYISALESCPGDTEIKTRISLAYYYSGIDYYNKSFYAEAVQDLSEAIKYNDNVAEYFAARGQAKYYVADYPGAYLDYKKALDLDPAHVEVKNRIKQFEMAGSNLTVAEDQKDDSLQDNVPIRNQIQTHKVTTDDMVEYLLNPRGPGHIPAHLRAKLERQKELLKKPHRESLTEAATRLIEMEEKLFEQGIDIDKYESTTGSLPPIHVIKKKNDLKAKAALTEKVSNERNKLWKLMEHAQHIAKQYRSKGDEIAASKIKSGGTMAKSAAGLKRQSQKESLLARSNPIIGGHTINVEPSTSGKSRILEVKKYISTKSLERTNHSYASTKLDAIGPPGMSRQPSMRNATDLSVSSNGSGDDDKVSLSEMSEMERRLRRKSLVYSLPEGPSLTVTKVGDQVLISNSITKTKYAVDSNKEENTELNKMSGEKMMAKFKDQLLRRTFQSLNDLAESKGEIIPASTTQLTDLIDQQLTNIEDHDQESEQSLDDESVELSNDMVGEVVKRRGKRVKIKSDKPDEPAPVGPNNWRVLEKQESGKASSLLILPEEVEARYLQHFREQEAMKERAKEEVIKALTFVKFSQKAKPGDFSGVEEEVLEEEKPLAASAEQVAAAKLSNTLYGFK